MDGGGGEDAGRWTEREGDEAGTQVRAHPNN